MNFLRFILRRAVFHWQILLTLSLGVMLSTGLLASGPLLVNTVVEFGLRNTLVTGDSLNRALRVTAFSVSAAPDTYAELNSQVDDLFARRFDPYLQQVISQAGTNWLFPWVENNVVETDRVNISFDEVLVAQTELIEGVFPENPFVAEETIAVAIGEEMANAYDLQVGDRLPLSRNRSADAPDLWLEIAGILRPQNPRDTYWSGSLNPLRTQSDERWRAQFNAFVPADQFFPVAEAYFTGGRAELYWNVLLDPTAVSVTDIPLLRARLDGLIFDLLDIMPTRPVITTRLGEVLASFAAQSEAVRAPLLLLTAEVVLLALYYVIMVAALSVKQVEREFAILRSRGASGSQIFRVQAGEALLISLVAFLSGPILGAALVRGLGVWGPLRDVSQGSWNLSLSQAAWLAAGIGALACLGGLLLPVGPALRRSIVTHTQSLTRDTRLPLWQRLYLDVFLLVGGLILLWRLRLYGGILGSNGGAQIDWLLLLSPLALLLGTGTILLRIFPLALRAGAALAARGRGLPTALAMWQTSRNPTHVARLVLLLTLAMSLGLLSTGINATLDLSELERAAYATGSDLRLESSFPLPVETLQVLSGVTGSSAAFRTTGSVAQGRGLGRFELWAIDPLVYAELTTFRSDFAAQPIPQLLDALAVGGPQPHPVLPLPGQPQRLGVWVWAGPEESGATDFNALSGDSNLDRIGLEARLQTASGQMIQVKLLPAETGGYPPDGWRYFSGGVPAQFDQAYPLSLHSFWIANRARRQFGNFGGFVPTTIDLALDDLTVLDRVSGEELTANDFDDIRQVWFASGDSYTAYSLTQARSGRGRLGLRLIFTEPGVAARVSLIGGEERQGAMPALINQAFQDLTDIQVGDIVRTTIASEPVEFEIKGIVNYFPTLYDNLEAGFLITQRDQLLNYFNDIKNRPLNANELLLELEPRTDTDAMAAQVLEIAPDISTVNSVEATRAIIKADPMALGLRSVTYFGYVITTALSLVGFATHFYLSARQRETVYAVLRSIGMSSRQLYGMLMLEQIVLVLFGLGLGTLLGLVLNQITLPGLPITLGDTLPIPPFIPRSDWLAVGRIYLFLTIGFLTALGLATWLLWRRKLHRILRIGEE